MQVLLKNEVDARTAQGGTNAAAIEAVKALVKQAQL